MRVETEFLQVDWTGLLNSMDCNENFNHFHNKTQEIMDSIAPLKLFRISAKQRYVEPWMTKGLEKAGRKVCKLYRCTLEANSSIKLTETIIID